MLEYMICMYGMYKPSKWKDYIHLAEIAYKNGKQASLVMSPFEVLYGKKCRTLVTWDNPVNRIVLGPELLKEMEQEVAKIRQNLKAAQDIKKIYDNKNRSEREFYVGYHVYL